MLAFQNLHYICSRVAVVYMSKESIPIPFLAECIDMEVLGLINRAEVDEQVRSLPKGHQIKLKNSICWYQVSQSK